MLSRLRQVYFCMGLSAGLTLTASGCGSGLIFFCDYSAGFATVDDITSGSGFLEATPTAMTTYGRNDLYIVGSGYPVAGDYNQWRGIVRKSSDGGQTWTSGGAAYQYGAATVTDYYGVATDSSGNPVISGTGQTAPDHLFVRKSTDGGQTWSTPAGTNDYVYPGGFSARGLGLLRLPGTNTLIQSGYANPVPYHSIVRVSTDGGSSWSSTLAMDLTHVAGGSISLFRAMTLGDGNYYLLGGQSDAGDVWSATVYKSTTPTTAWLTPALGTFRDSGGTAGTRVVMTGLGRAISTELFAAARIHDGTRNHWQVRRSVDGATWTLVEDYTYATNQPAAGQGLFVDVKRNLYVIGAAFDGIRTHFVVRKGANYGQSWTFLDDYTFAGNVADDSQYEMATAVNDRGDMFYSFTVSDGAGAYHWVTRKSECK